MSDVMLFGVLRMPPDMWRDDPLDKAQRHSRYLQAADEIERLRVELGITGDACGALDSEVKQLRARVAELEAVLTQIAGMTSIAHGNHAAYVAAGALRAGPMKLRGPDDAP